jgi:hypothetical protein
MIYNITQYTLLLITRRATKKWLFLSKMGTKWLLIKSRLRIYIYIFVKNKYKNILLSRPTYHKSSSELYKVLYLHFSRWSTIRCSIYCRILLTVQKTVRNRGVLCKYNDSSPVSRVWQAPAWDSNTRRVAEQPMCGVWGHWRLRPGMILIFTLLF